MDVGPPSWIPSRVFGQRSLAETAYNEVVPGRVFHPGGVLVDRMPAPTPSRLYVWDAGNNRILALPHAATCVGGSNAGAGCTEHGGCGSDGQCTGPLDIGLIRVIGQPAATGYSACNGDNTREAPASSSSLCAVPYPYQISPLEGPRGNSMAVDSQHRLYVADPFNNRVLRYGDPFASDGIADAVWGQPDFVSRACNQGLSAPTASTLCLGEVDRFYPNYYFSAGVDVSADGNTLWVADLGNHRVLRIPTAGAAADLVLGQGDLASAEANCTPPYPADRLCKPNAVRFDEQSGKLYVVDGDDIYARLLVFSSPQSNGMAAQAVYGGPAGSTLKWARGLTLDPTVANGVWLADTDNSRLLRYVEGAVDLVLSKMNLIDVGCIGGMIGDGLIYPQVCNPHGSLGIDREGNVYAGDLQEQHVERFPVPFPAPGAGHARSPDLRMFYAGTFHANQIGASGLANPGDLLIVGDQLLIADRQRILFWNHYAQGALAAGNASGALAAPDMHTQGDQNLTHGLDFTALAHDGARALLYAAHGPYLTAWSTAGGLASQRAPEFQVSSPLPLRGGGSVSFHSAGIDVDAATDTAWLSDAQGHRLLRVLQLSNSSRQVDAILGQPDLSSVDCNRSRGRSSPAADSLCIPTQVRFDRAQNLYVVDGTWEGNGNQRVLEFDAASLPPIPSSALFPEVSAARVYAKASLTAVDCNPDTVSQPCTPRFISFEPGTNRMILTVDGYGNPLDSRAFYYDEPIPAGVTAVTPSGRIPLRFNQAAASAWDAAGRLAILDHTWNRAVLIQNPPP
ncbi:MAG: hypothetical protein JXR83_18090 [Deltaproteobacteria bacterium]|nr:hypothetical protein [Deltaproteobacteria bacterium]